MTDSRKIFIDTSAVIAVLTQEDGHSLLIAKMRDASSVYTSPLVILEASMRLGTILGVTSSDAQAAIRALLEGAGADICPIEDKSAKVAVDAFERYGNGRGHPAQLNLADCFSYACAREQNCAILCVGNDFSQTDLVAA